MRRMHNGRWGRTIAAACALALVGMANLADGGDDGSPPYSVRLRSRVESEPGTGRYRVVEKAETWAPPETAIIVCDMWDSHHCLNAVRRATEMAPRMEQLLKAARARGSLIIHAPSGCMETYKDHPARKRALETPRSKDLPKDIGQWCRQVPAEERGTYPIDQSDGGEDDDPAEHAEWVKTLAAQGRNPNAPWKSEIGLLSIDPDADVISDSGEEIWSVLEARGTKNVVLLGVHLNMCVLGRPFGLRQMAKNGKNVVLMRDLTDTMYNPKCYPYVGHFDGTDLMVEHVEKFVAPTIASDQILGGAPARFRADHRPRVVFAIADDEYKTEVTLPEFAASRLAKGHHVEYVLGSESKSDSERNNLPGLNVLDDADVLVISARRRVLPKPQMDALRRYVAEGKGVVGIRTASHAFSLAANKPAPAGFEAWTTFDAEVLGGNYHGHHGPGPDVAVRLAPGASGHPILNGVDVAKLAGHGSLYKVGPIAETATPLLIGSIPGQAEEPVAWVNAPATKNRVFYTSLGQIDDFRKTDFPTLLKNAIDWAAGK